MFLAALARRRYEPPRKQHWDGKVGIWSFTSRKVAKKGPRQVIFVQQDNAKSHVPPSNLDIVAAEPKEAGTSGFGVKLPIRRI
ncbi:hypothetical protein F442_16816 [Phytophthora nicotianae P10297]|uniref:Uncharacterized protein n=1 Tax=Phytophthora nicotianae P10297 TaxID=1317064 RepID=W2YJ39_PHYNI|nr:hypothetical protein F442_16816 [Phytophthora nicotianae P10297]